MKRTVLDMSVFACSMINEAQRNLFQFLENTEASNYDRIMDSVYNDTLIGGGLHRHFDGSHTLMGSYEKIQAAEGEVNILGYARAHLDEIVTPNGIPLFNLNHADFNRLTNEVADATGGILSGGQIRTYLCDMNSINAGELLSAGLGSLFLFMALRSGDSKAIARTSALNLSLGFLTGNPLQVVTGLAGVGIGVYQGKIQAWDMLKGAAPAIAGFGAGELALALGAPNWAGAGIGLAGGIGVAMLMDHLEKKKRQALMDELGNYQRYVPVITPPLVQRQIEIAMRKQLTLGVSI